MTGKIQFQESLISAAAKKLQEQYGKNELVPQKKRSFLRKTLHIVCQPMFALLIAAAVIYFILGEPRDGAMAFVIAAASVLWYEIVKMIKKARMINRSHMQSGKVRNK